MRRWLRSVKEIAAIGGWIAVSLFFMAQAAGYISSPNTKTYELLQSHDMSLANHRVRQDDLIQQWTTALRILCENGSHSAAERNNCQNIGR